MQHRIEPTFGSKKLNEIKHSDVGNWQMELKDSGLSIKTIRSLRGILSVILYDALKEGITSTNPSKNAPTLSERNVLKNSSNNINPFTIEEINKIKNNTSKPQMKNFYMLLFMTGVRGGEAIALKWKDIDFENRIIDINCQITRGKEVPPKWNSQRKIPILDGLEIFLKEQYKITGHYDGYVFLNTRKSRFWDISKIRDKYWRRDLELSNVPYRKIHQTRHTFCSSLISKGEDINTVSKIAGHSSTSMTLSTYSKSIGKYEKDFGKTLSLSIGTA